MSLLFAAIVGGANPGGGFGSLAPSSDRG